MSKVQFSPSPKFNAKTIFVLCMTSGVRRGLNLSIIAPIPPADFCPKETPCTNIVITTRDSDFTKQTSKKLSEGLKWLSGDD